ncbi:Rac/Rho-like_protein [Hexamita inflata]|uniref:Rac/Rho-like protein n=1 Tax=Hexamita inflata TaxID=28002 RepID=A0AA86RE69_9EUKA|nr:Rac/Rho-like protein [Hexamita inflata]
MNHYDIVVVGNSQIGKSRALLVYQNQEYYGYYPPALHHNEFATIDGEKIVFSLQDTPGHEDYNQVRPLLYFDSSLFLVCYAVDDRTSFNDLTNRWIPEIKQYLDEIPFIIVGLKNDLRYEANDVDVVTEEEACQLAQRCGAHSHILCSAFSNYNINFLINTAVRVAKQGKPKRKKNKCF